MIYKIILSEVVNVVHKADKHEVVEENYGFVLRLTLKDKLVAEYFTQYIYGFTISDE